MHLQITGEIIIEAPASKVWRVLAREFANIGQWASVIPRSTAVTHHSAINGANVSGRVCSNSVPGLGDIQEEFIAYNEAAMRFAYIATQGMPSFVKQAENHFAVHPLTANQCRVEMRGDVELASFPGLFLAPLMKLHFRRIGVQTAEELKYFIEHDRPHPRKLRAVVRL